MSKRESPTVVFIDDEQEELKPLAQSVSATGMLGCNVAYPDEVDIELLRDADLVIVDYNLKNWFDSVETSTTSLVPSNGIALCAVLREYYRNPKLTHYPPTGFALITGEPQGVCSAPGERRPHVVARLSNLEWYFEKHDNHDANVNRISSLATAIHSLPSNLSSQILGLEALMNLLLGVEETDPLLERYSDSVSYCRPPIHHLSKESGGLVLLRWLLHRILPHTCFLLCQTELAARLRVSPESLERELSNSSELVTALAPYSYKGLLSDFDGRRWWRGGIEQFLWDITDGESMDSDALRASMEKVGASLLSPIDITRPVATIDETFKTEAFLSSINDTVALHLDDWPSYAEPAYLRKDLLLKNEDLQLFVVHNQGFN
jgi:hypothetical protein